MKIKLLILTNFILNSFLLGQSSNTIKVFYEGIIKPNEKNIIKNTQGNSETKRVIINEMSKVKDYLLISNKYESIFEEVIKVDNRQKDDNVKFGNNEGLQLYINNKDSLLYEQVNLQKLFLVKEELNTIKWILDRGYYNEDKNIKKAYYLDSINKMNIIAYYSTELNYRTGPDRYWGLPGLIIELKIEYFDENSIFESFTFKAKKITEDLKSSINVPKGKIISKKQYREIIEKVKKFNKETDEY